jgi:methyl-accepting chemotaxis protein
LGGVNETVRKMDRVTHDNAAMVDATTKANHELALEARQLARLVGRFETGQRRQAQLPAPAPMLATAVADR